MDTVYIALVRWRPEWDGQSIYYTSSKAMFDQLDNLDYQGQRLSFGDFSEELKEQVRAVRAAFIQQHPDVELEGEEDTSISDAMEWLEVIRPKLPVIVAGETEVTCRWNW